MELLGDLGGGSKNSMKSVDSGRFPIIRGPAKEGQGSFLVNAKLDSLKLGTAKVELGKLPKTDGFAKLMIPPTGIAALGTSPRAGTMDVHNGRGVKRGRAEHRAVSGGI